jgi:transcriptional regulator GlxA family with amidase domain
MIQAQSHCERFYNPMRIEKAERLIRNTDLNISEIVYSIDSLEVFRKYLKKNTIAQSKEYKYSQKIATTQFNIYDFRVSKYQISNL